MLSSLPHDMKQNPLLITLLILFAAVLYATIIAPQLQIVLGRYDHLQALRDLISQGEALQEQRDQLQAQKNTIPSWKRDLIENAKMQYSSEEVVRFVIDLNALLVRSALGASTPYTVGVEQRDASGSVTVPIAFSFPNIEYEQLLLFLERLSTWDRGVNVQSVQISASQTGTASDTAVQATVAIEALFSETAL